jgi:hypothetical protein
VGKEYTMGMDVYSKNGGYFRASIWSWPDIMAATEAAIGQPVPDSWHSNDGEGLEGYNMTADQIAQAIEDHFFPDGKPANPETRVPVQADPTTLKGTAAMREGILQALREQAGFTVVKGAEDEGPCAGHLWEWVKFLRESGGDFEIW